MTLRFCEGKEESGWGREAARHHRARDVVVVVAAVGAARGDQRAEEQWKIGNPLSCGGTKGEATREGMKGMGTRGSDARGEGRGRGVDKVVVVCCGRVESGRQSNVGSQSTGWKTTAYE